MTTNNNDNTVSKFSTGLMLSDLDDFITPAQECIKPVKIDNLKRKDIASIEIDDANNSYVQVNIDGSRTQLKKTKIELSDCLACSGCVTSAESVLVNQQSVKEFLDRLHALKIYPFISGDQKKDISTGDKQKDTTNILIMSISPQSRASISAHFGINSVVDCMEKLTTFCKQHLGAEYVFDTTWSRNIALMEMCEEFIHRYQQEHSVHKEGEKGGIKDKTSSSLSTESLHSTDITPRISKRRKKTRKHLPLLSSACPGWVCYAEKTQEDILPYISTSKSPQQVMGTAVKQYLAKKNKINSATIYHVTVMPCYDKKLEASREDFVTEDLRDVDMVLTTSELLELIEKHGKVTLPNLPPSKIDPFFNELLYCTDDKSINADNNSDSWKIGGINGGSGGYCETVFRYAALKLFNKQIKASEIQWKLKRKGNDDYKMCTLEIDGKTVLNFAICYGFRNIQNLVRIMKDGSCSYDFVEVMACPKGCVNGGGQIKAPEQVNPREFLSTVDQIYHKVQIEDMTTPDQVFSKQVSNVTTNPMELYEKWISDKIFSQNARKQFHTQYHAREKLNIVNPLTIKW